jgi:hypothetical protein
VAASVRRPIEQCARFVDVERCLERPQLEVEVAERDRHIGPDPDDDGLGASELERHGQRSERAGEEGVDDVEQADVDDHSAGSVAPDLLGEFVAEREDLAVTGSTGLKRSS